MKFETVVDSWYNSISWSSSTDAYAIFLSLCQHIGVTGDWYFGNKNFPISNTLDAVNLQGRTVLRYLAEIAGQFCYATSTGSIKMEGFGGGVGLLDNTRYFQMTLADYQCP